MNRQIDNNAFLQLEETLQILEESIKVDAVSNQISLHHIQRLKQLYSPLFNFEHSETGSYYYSAIKCVCVDYTDTDAKFDLPLSHEFKQSLNYLLTISLLSLNLSLNKSQLTEQLLLLSELWELNSTLDIPTLLLQTLTHMRLNLYESCSISN